MPNNDSAWENLIRQIADLRAKQADNKYELLKEIHRVRDNTIKNLIAVITTVLAILAALGLRYFLPDLIADEIRNGSREEIQELSKSIKDAEEIERRLRSPLIVFVSDGGNSDDIVGTIYQNSPRVRIHQTGTPNPSNRFSKLHASWSLLKATRQFPDSTIFVSPANPGASENRVVLLEIEVPALGEALKKDRRTLASRFLGRKGDAAPQRERTLFLIGYDNGVMDLVAEAYTVKRYHEIDIYEIPQAEGEGNVVHMESVLARTAGDLSNGTQVKDLGSSRGSYFRKLAPDQSHWYRAEFNSRQANYKGVVLEIDEFGNALTNIPIADLQSGLGVEPGAILEIQEPGGKEKMTFTYAMKYSDVPRTEWVGVNQNGFLQLAINEGSLANHLSWGPERTVLVRVSE